MKDTTHIYKLKDIDFETRLVPEQVLEIANDYLNKHDANGMINRNTIMFNSEDDVSCEGVWILTIEPCNHYGMLDNAYNIVISDYEGKVVYLLSNHGRIITI